MRRHASVWLAIALYCLTTVSGKAAFIGVEESEGQGISLVIMGKIVLGDAERFRQVVIQQLNQGKWIGSVKLFSPGGSMYDGMSIGRQIRTLRASTLAPTRLDNPDGVYHCLTQLVQPGFMMYDP